MLLFHNFITLLPSLSKIHEKIMKAFLEKYIYKNNTLHHNQFAIYCIKERFREDAVLKITGTIVTLHRNYRHVVLSSFDCPALSTKLNILL